MPTYEYRCKSCGEELEVVQSFTDDALTECPACGGALRKVFGSIGITFKGSGFYKTDSRSGSSTSAKKDGDKADKAEKSDSSEKSDKAGSTSSSDAGSSSTGSGDAGSSSSTSGGAGAKGAKDAKGSKGSASKPPAKR